MGSGVTIAVDEGEMTYWTNEPPTEPGWYWYRPYPDALPRPVLVVDDVVDVGGLFLRGEVCPHNDISAGYILSGEVYLRFLRDTARWGPKIEMPEEPEG